MKKKNNRKKLPMSYLLITPVYITILVLLLLTLTGTIRMVVAGG